MRHKNAHWNLMAGLFLVMPSFASVAQNLVDVGPAANGVINQQTDYRGVALGQKNRMPSDAEIEREREAVEKRRREVFGANQEHKMGKNTFPNIKAPPVSNIDIQEIAKQYEQRALARPSDELMIFASFTMPRESLRRLIQQAGRVGGYVVLNGFLNNSMAATSKAINELGESGSNVSINPKAFEKYRIKSVPTMVIAKPSVEEKLDEDGCALPSTYVSISGDVSLDYMLEEVARRSEAFKVAADGYLRQIRVSGK